MSANVLQSSLFSRQKKKLRPVKNRALLGARTEMSETLSISNGAHKNQIEILDKEIQKIIEDLRIGEQKKGDLKTIWVHKFDAGSQLFLLAYKWDSKTRNLIAIHAHENFYRDLKRYLK